MIDALIIGGGIAGVSLGARLAPHMGVHLLEAEEALGYHASGRSAALFEETYGKPSTTALNRASRLDHQTLDGGVLSPRGLMLVTQEDDDTFRTDMRVMHMEPISVADACAMIPILDAAKLVAAGHHADAWDIDTDRLIQVFARQIRQAGGTVQMKSPVEAIRKDKHWIVTAGGKEIEARLLINASGSWVDEIAKMAKITPIGFTPMRRSMARLAAPGGHDVSAWPMLFGPGENWYAKPDAGALLVSPAEEDPSAPMDAWADDMVLAEGLARYEDHVTEPVTRPIATWAGLRTFAPDRNLCIGFDAGDPDFFWCAGQGGYGFQTAPAASRFGADVILGRASELDAETQAALNPKRFPD
ncbi:NAD(P)/FAD-dependent oxidoreductase [Shimia ponticola]|uniref:NAD(P)/FAD-dependent oxidoreductase n=1 Tax=Shimia ponticola TaxID=2582893 RepID=UPI0011BF4391|nr:FAD-binding oxidoreductase [Shimia ponticola]